LREKKYEEKWKRKEGKGSSMWLRGLTKTKETIFLTGNGSSEKHIQIIIGLEGQVH